VFAVLFVVGWFASGGDAPDYAAADQEWTEWAEDNEWKSRIGAFAMLLAGFVFLHFAGTIRSVLGTAETTARGSAQLARVAAGGEAGTHGRYLHRASRLSLRRPPERAARRTTRGKQRLATTWCRQLDRPVRLS
jgi:hypothetical protein